MLDLPPPLWLPPKPAVIRAAPADLLRPELGMLPGMVPIIAGAAGPGFPSIVDTTTASVTSTAASCNIAMPTLTSGNTLVMLVTLHINSGATVSTPSGWTSLYTQTSNINYVGGAAFYKTSDGTESTITLTKSGSNCLWGVICFILDGACTISAAMNNFAYPGTTADFPNLSPGSSAKRLWIAALGSRTAAPSAPTDYTQHQTAGGNNGRVTAYIRELEAASEDPTTLSVANGGYAATLGIAFS